MAVNNISLD